MTDTTLSQALEREHRDIDGGIEEYTAALGRGDTNPAPLQRAMDALRRHIYLEEDILFPPLKAAGMVMPIFVMIREHGELWDAMDHLDTLIASDTDPDTLVGACRELLAQLDNHNSKEEPIIYPHADTGLDADTAQKLTDFIERGRMPDGWRAEKAR
ncbi:MAG TPA: hemerythrin domain-containing protein [Terrimesophilobacter sp.]|nr:hemerythrin domain-containing protein [Terrimesophilobacter sp.]